MDAERCVICNAIIPEDRQVCPKCENAEPTFSITKINISLNNLKDISAFIRLASKCSGDVVIISGHYAVNAKSILGVFSLDLSHPVVVEFYGAVPIEVQKRIKKYMI